MGKSELSPGSKTNIGTRLNKILSKKSTEFVAELDDKYMKLALVEFLNDLGFSKKVSSGNFVLVSIKMGVYKFYKDKPIEGRVYNIPSEWDIFKLKVEKGISEKPLPKKVNINKGKVENNTKQEESRIYLLDKDNKRYYKGKFDYKNNSFSIDTFENKVNISSDSNIKYNEKKIIKEISNNNIDIISEDETKLKVYDSKKDGELKTKNEKEIEERMDELKEKGFINLSDGTVIISDEEKYSKHLKEIENKENKK